MDLTVLSPSFPKTQYEIERPNFLDTIEGIFETPTELLVLEGPDGIGKTTLLAQFAKRFPDHTVSCFVTYKNTSGGDPEVIKDVIYEQIVWALYKEERRADGFVSDAMYNIEISRLSRKAQRDNSTYFFVLDGLDEFPFPAEESRIQGLLRLLPFGQPAFKFLVTGDSTKLQSLLGAGVLTKAFPLSGFTLGETARFLADLSLTEEVCSELHQFAQKIPGRLASIRRSINAGSSVTDILAGTGSGMDFFDLEWASTDPGDETQMRILALIAHNDKVRKPQEIADMLDLTKETVDSKVSALPFIQSSLHGLGYFSEAFRAYVSLKLQSLGTETGDLIIEHLLKSPDTAPALTELPAYLEKNERYDELLKYLSYEHFTKLLSVAESLVPLKRQLDLGISASAHMGRDRELLRLTLESASLEQLSNILRLGVPKSKPGFLSTTKMEQSPLLRDFL